MTLSWIFKGLPLEKMFEFHWQQDTSYRLHLLVTFPVNFGVMINLSPRVTCSRYDEYLYINYYSSSNYIYSKFRYNYHQHNSVGMKG